MCIRDRARGEGWTKFSAIDNVNYGAVVENSFKDNPNSVGVDATYFDYWSDMEQEKGYLQCQGNDNICLLYTSFRAGVMCGNILRTT